MAEKTACPGYRVRANGEYTHICENCSGVRGSAVNFGLVYEGDKDLWRNGVSGFVEKQIADARAAGLDPEPVGRGRWV